MEHELCPAQDSSSNYITSTSSTSSPNLTTSHIDGLNGRSVTDQRILNKERNKSSELINHSGSIDRLIAETIKETTTQHTLSGPRSSSKKWIPKFKRVRQENPSQFIPNSQGNDDCDKNNTTLSQPTSITENPNN